MMECDNRSTLNNETVSLENPPNLNDSSKQIKEKQKEKICSNSSQNEGKTKKNKANQNKLSFKNAVKKLTRSNLRHSNPDNDSQSIDDIESKTDETPEEIDDHENVPLQEKMKEFHEKYLNDAMDLSSLDLIDKDIPLIIREVFLKNKNRYQHLILRDNHFTAIGMKTLADRLLKIATRLRNLGVSSNRDIGDQGIEHLVRLIKEKKSITILSLHNTGLTDEGVRFLADSLCPSDGNPALISLEKLYISFNKSITDQALEHLIRIIEQNQSLRVFSLQHCNLSDKARRRLRSFAAKKKKGTFFAFSD